MDRRNTLAQLPGLKLSPRHRARQIMRQWISRGVLAGGQPLPSERMLGENLGISRTVVRNVVNELVEEGLIVQDKGGCRLVRVEEDSAKINSSELVQSAIAVLTSLSAPREDHHLEPGWVEHMTQGAIAGSRQFGRDVMIVHPERMADGGVGRLLSARPLGVVVPEPGRPLPGQGLWLHRLASAGIPVVVFGDSEELADFDRVMPDHEGGTYELTRWVISQGRKRIANLAGNQNDSYWYQNRMRGYNRAMREAGLQPMLPEIYTPLNSVLPDDFGPRMTIEAKFDIERHQVAGHIAPLLNGDDPVDAILVGNDGQAIIAAAALRVLGKEPGRDVLLVGYDNIWSGCLERKWESAMPAATVDKCNSQIGQELVRLLMDRVEGRLPQEPQRRIVPSRLVVL